MDITFTTHINKTCFVAKHAVFLEKEFLNVVASGRNVELEEIQGEPQTNTLLKEPEED